MSLEATDLAHRPDGPPAVAACGIAASLDAWCRLLAAARELKDVDEEMMDTFLDDAASAHGEPGADAAKIRSLAALMRSLDLDPEAIRRGRPETMRVLEAACLGCTARDRCDRALRTGAAKRTYPAFCPNAPRLDALRGPDAGHPDGG